MTSQCYALKSSMLNQKNSFETSQIDKSYSFQEDDELLEDFEKETLLNNVEESKKTKLNWILGSSIPTILTLILDAPLVYVKDNKIEKLIEKLEKDNIKINEGVMICELTRSITRGLGYIEGHARAISASEEFLLKLVKHLVFLTAYDTIDEFFNLGVCRTKELPDLLKLSRTQGDEMVSKYGHDEKYINDKIKESNLYIEKIKEKFNNLSISEAFDKINLYSEKTDHNENKKISLLYSLTITKMEPERLDNLIKGIINDS